VTDAASDQYGFELRDDCSYVGFPPSTFPTIRLSTPDSI
jgi:hypothetical protein